MASLVGSVVGALGGLFSKPKSNPMLDLMAGMVKKYGPEYMARLNQMIYSGMTPELLAQQRANDASTYNDENLAFQNYQRALQNRGLGKSQLMASGLAGLARGFGGMRAANRANILQQLAQLKQNALAQAMGYTVGKMPDIAGAYTQQNAANSQWGMDMAKLLGNVADQLSTKDKK